VANELEQVLQYCQMFDNSTSNSTATVTVVASTTTSSVVTTGVTTTTSASTASASSSFAQNTHSGGSVLSVDLLMGCFAIIFISFMFSFF
jgi:hypothetical protein